MRGAIALLESSVFPIPTAITKVVDTPTLHLGVGIAYAYARLALPSQGKGRPLRERKREASVRKKVKTVFDPKKFLAKVGEGKTVSHTGRIKLFSPKEKLRMRSFTFSKARSSSPSFPSKARKRWLQSWDPVIFLAKDV